eukprot:CAMPEP_0174892686 /NCGR_PEP_ID=MMETSP0167-20121228/7599_1 /TAXON_ID=38298 /ORGANISM="Rhodella maculata, Strain CCMP736" /LENGTH=258 /DNA_ID=CAMNT_0016131263 /DNA_START=61 /DNA_END=837 /DNA_ORIENTATION=+
MSTAPLLPSTHAKPRSPPLDPEYDLESLLPPGPASVATASPATRLAFLRKVYSILALQLALTAAIALFLSENSLCRNFLVRAPWVPLALLLPTLALLIALHVFRESHPLNMWLLLGFTLCEAGAVGSIVAVYVAAEMGGIVIEALGLTVAVFLGLTAYCFWSRKDFSFLGGYLFSALVILMVASLGNAVLESFGVHTPLRMLTNGVFGALVMSGYILFDTSLLINKLNPDQYIEAVISLYLDIINLFLQILQALTPRN